MTKLRDKTGRKTLLLGLVLAIGTSVLIAYSANATVIDGSPAYEVLVDDFGLQDSWLAAEQQLSPAWSTFPFFQDVEESPFRIDWILLSQDMQILDARINDTRPDGVFPSDHLPVQARVVLPGA